MAILNFANTYQEIADKLTLTESNSGDYIKLYFSKDGHIITHGKDFTALFKAGVNGLVPGSNGLEKEILRGNGTWAELTTSDLPMASTIQEASATNLLSAQQIIQYVGESFAANDAMRYKGTISFANGAYTTVSTGGIATAGFPTKCEIGDTYRVTSQGQYAGQTCSLGDLLICIQDGEGDSLNAREYWTAVETNINGSVIHSLNNSPFEVYSSSTTTFTWFAPTSGGIQNQVLLSSGNSAPVWKNQSELRVGEASKVTNALLAGVGLSFGSDSASYDGSTTRTLRLLIASTSTLGGVIIDKDHTNKTISITDEGSIYLTAQNIINALGYDPGGSNSWRPITIGGNSIGDKTLNFVPTGDIYVKTDYTDDDIQDISFGLSWYNLSTKKYEYE